MCVLVCVAIVFKCDCKIAWIQYYNNGFDLCKLWGQMFVSEMHLDFCLVISDPKYEGEWN